MEPCTDYRRSVVPSGGSYNSGTAFSLTTAGSVRVIHNFGATCYSAGNLLQHYGFRRQRLHRLRLRNRLRAYAMTRRLANQRGTPWES